MITNYRCPVCREYTTDTVLILLDATMGGAHPSVMICPTCANKYNRKRLATEAVSGMIETIDAAFTNFPGEGPKLETEAP